MVRGEHRKSCPLVIELIRAMTGGGVFSNYDHLRTLVEERRDGKKDQDDANETKLKGLV